MARFGRVVILGFLAAGFIVHGAVLAAETPPAARQQQVTSTATPAVALTADEIETFLQKGRVVSMRPAGKGVTGSRRATISDGALTHDAHVQVIDQAMPVFQARGVTELNFTDSYRYNIAAYRVARLLGLDNVPISVERHMDGKTAAVTWWIENVQVDEKERVKRRLQAPDRDAYTKQLQIMRIFDELIQNRDRNQGNIIWADDWKLWLIDHTRAFRTGTTLTKPDQLMRIERSLLTRIRELTSETLLAATDGLLTNAERAALLARKDRIVAHYDARVARAGEDVVLFTVPRPS